MQKVHFKESNKICITIITGCLLLVGCLSTGISASPTNSQTSSSNVDVSTIPIPTINLSHLTTLEASLVHSIAWSPDSKIFAFLDGQKDESGLHVHDTNSYQELWFQESTAFGLTFSLDGKNIALSFPLEGLIQTRDAEDGSVTNNLQANNCSGGEWPIFKPNGSVLLVGHTAGHVTWYSNINSWDMTTSQCQQLLKYNGYLSYFSVNENATLAAISTKHKEQLVYIWDIEQQVEVCKTQGDFGIFVPNNHLLAISKDQRLRFLDPYTCDFLQEYPIDRIYNGYLTFSLDGKLFATAGEDIQLRETATGKLVSWANLPDDVEPSGSQPSFVFSPNNQFLLAAFSKDNRDIIQLWQLSP